VDFRSSSWRPLLDDGPSFENWNLGAMTKALINATWTRKGGLGAGSTFRVGAIRLRFHQIADSIFTTSRLPGNLVGSPF
jgi:hypothetical protein